jgi:hypothetical protein
MIEVSIKIPLFEKTVEVAKEFLQKVIVPPLEEVGGLLTDQIRFVRFKRQVDTLIRADNYLKE